MPALTQYLPNFLGEAPAPCSEGDSIFSELGSSVDSHAVSPAQGQSEGKVVACLLQQVPDGLLPHEPLPFLCFCECFKHGKI